MSGALARGQGAPPTPTRLGIGPVNSAGQADAWARATRAHGGADAYSFAFGAPPLRRRLATSFPADRHLPHPRLTPRAAKAALLRRLLRDTTHLAIDSFASLYDRPDRSDAGAELERLRREHPQLTPAFVAHGSDLRDPDRHADRLPGSYYRSAPAEWTDRLRRVAERNRRIARESGLPLFVSTPDLLLEDVEATWLPVTVDPIRWTGAPHPFARDRPVVLHVPSRRVPPIKGTDVIDPVLRRLDAAGRIRYVTPEHVAPAEMPALVRSCDVLVEQVRSGYYSAAAVEGMAAGRLVVSSLAPDVAALMPERPPLLDVPEGALRDVLEDVLADPDEARGLAARGPGFVARFHDGRAAAHVLAGWLGTAPSGGGAQAQQGR